MVTISKSMHRDVQIKHDLMTLMTYLRVIKSCLIWTSSCMVFEVVTIDLHYMCRKISKISKNIKIENTVETKTPISWIPLR